MKTISNAKHKARKDHKCNWCNCVIEKGTIYTRQFLINNGETYEWKNHIHCEEIANKLKMFDDCDYGVDEENFHETISEQFIMLMEHYESEVFNYEHYRYPSFKEKLEYVCKMHDIETPKN